MPFTLCSLNLALVVSSKVLTWSQDKVNSRCFWLGETKEVFCQYQRRCIQGVCFAWAKLVWVFCTTVTTSGGVVWRLLTFTRVRSS